MIDLREAAQQALEALENCRIEYDYHGNPLDEENAALVRATDALRAALAIVPSDCPETVTSDCPYQSNGQQALQGNKDE